jgi:uncharacterized ion transporter superfamily protein YfcC
MNNNEKSLKSDSISHENDLSKRLSSKIPDAFVILFIVIMIATVCSYIVPAGSFETMTTSNVVNGEVIERTSIKKDSFVYANASASTGDGDKSSGGVPIFASGGEMGMFNYAFEGMVSGTKWGSAIGVIAFILIVGGAFGIIMKTQAINNGIVALINKTKKADLVIIPLMFVLFSLGGAIFGMGEEAIAFSIVLVPLMVALGYDAITGILVTYVATQIGFATSWMNPFSVAIAQGIADVPLLSGKEFRMAAWLVFTMTGLAFTLWHARRVKANPSLSICPDSNAYFAKQTQSTSGEYSWVDSAVLLWFLLGIFWVLWGVTLHAYYIPEIATQFFIIGIGAGIIAMAGSRMRLNEISEAFQQGAKDLLPAALIVGMAKGIVLILGGDDVTQPTVLNTILYVTSNAIGDSNDYINASAMLAFQTFFNFFIASGSGQAAITMPLMAPLADLVGVTRQVAVLAFQLGDGFSNMIFPTSAALIGCLGVARIDWSIWLAFIWKFFLGLFTLAFACIVVAVAIGYS